MEENKFYFRIQKNIGQKKKVIYLGTGNDKDIKNILKNEKGSFTIFKKKPNEKKFTSETIYINTDLNELEKESKMENSFNEQIKFIELFLKMEFTLKTIENKIDNILELLKEETDNKETNIDEILSLLNNKDLNENSLKSLLELIKK